MAAKKRREHPERVKVPAHAPPIVQLLAAVMATEGVSRSELARRMGEDPGYVGSYMRRNGVLKGYNDDSHGFSFGIRALAALGYGLVISAERLDEDSESAGDGS